MKKKIFAALLMLVVITAVHASSEVYEFSSATQKERFQSLTSELRCLVCQNQNLAESNAGLANDLRDAVFLKIQQGQSDKDIINYLVARYGNFILYQPPLNTQTMALWLLPIFILSIGLTYLIIYLLRNQRRSSC